MTRLALFTLWVIILVFIGQGVLYWYWIESVSNLEFEFNRRLDKFDKSQLEKFQTLNDDLEEIQRSIGSLNDYVGLTVTDELGFINIPIFEDTFPLIVEIVPIVEVSESQLPVAKDCIAVIDGKCCKDLIFDKCIE